MENEITEITATYRWSEDDYSAYVQAKALAIPPTVLKSPIPQMARASDSAWVIFGPALLSVAIVFGVNMLPEPGAVFRFFGQNKGTLFFVVTIAAWISLAITRLRMARRNERIQKAVFLNLIDIDYTVRFWAKGFSYKCAEKSCAEYWGQGAVDTKQIDGYLLIYAHGVFFALRNQVLSCAPDEAQDLILGWAKAGANPENT